MYSTFQNFFKKSSIKPLDKRTKESYHEHNGTRKHKTEVPQNTNEHQGGSTMNVFTIKEVREYLESVNATECRVHDYSYEEKDCSEDPIAQLFSVADTVAWLEQNPAYNRGGEDAGYLLVIFNAEGFVEELIF